MVLLALIAATRFVAADVVNVRVEPANDAEIAARLRINTAIVTTAGDATWTAIAYDGAAKPVRGWVKTELLVEEKLSVTKALQLATLGKKDERLKWAERAVAMAPADTNTVKALVGAAKAAKQPERSARALKFAGGGTAIYVAVCRTKAPALFPSGAKARVELLAIVDPIDGPKEVVFGDALLRDLTSSPWWTLPRKGTARMLEGSPFAAARGVEYWNEEAEEEAQPAGDAPKIVLGECDAPGTLYATGPLAGVPSKPVAAVKAEPLRAALVHLVGAERASKVVKDGGMELAPVSAVEVAGFISATVRGTWSDPRALQYAAANEGYEPPVGFADAWALIDRGGKIVETLGMPGGENDSVTEVLFASPRFSKPTTLAIVFHHRAPQEDGKADTSIATVILVRAGTPPRKIDVEIEGSGC